jgi:hypothetical protein
MAPSLCRAVLVLVAAPARANTHDPIWDSRDLRAQVRAPSPSLYDRGVHEKKIMERSLGQETGSLESNRHQEKAEMPEPC